MINAGEVGATFTIVDEASPVLRRMMEQFDALQGVIDRTKGALDTLKMPPGLNRSLGIMANRFKAVSDASKMTADSVALGFGKIDTSIGTTRAALGELAREIRTVGRESRALGVASLRSGTRSPGAGAVSGAGGHGSGPVHFAGAAVPLPGDQHARIAGGPALAAGAAIAYGAFEEAKIQDFVNRMFITGGHKTTDLASDPLYARLRESIVKSYTLTGLPLEQIEEGVLTGVRGLSGLDFDKRAALMPSLLTASAVEAYLKDGTTIPEAMQSFVGLAHMEGRYSPDEIGKLADHFAYLSTTTPVSVKQIENAASYAIPMLRTADFDPEQILLMITSMERAGITNTKAGTWISQLATQSFPGTSLMSKMLFKRHEGALKDLGLIDDHDAPTWFTDGRPDLVKMTGIAGAAIEKMDPAHRLAIEKALWGQQGGRAAGFFADPTNRAIMGRVADDEKDFISGEAMWKQSLESSPIVQFRTAFAGLNVELMNLGSNVLPYVTGMLKAANQTLGGKGELAVIGAGLAAFAFPKLTKSALLGLASTGLPGAIAAGTIATGALIYENPPTGLSPGAPTPWGPAGRVTRSDLPYLNNQNLQGIGNEFPQTSGAGATLQATVSTTVPVTVNIDGNKVADAILPKIEQKLSAMMHSLGSLMGAPNDVAHYNGPGIGHQ